MNMINMQFLYIGIQSKRHDNKIEKKKAIVTK